MTTTTHGLVAASAIHDAARALAGTTVRTPLLPGPWLSDEVDTEIRLKCENLQHVGAFKARGAFTMVSRLPDAQRQRGIITYSSGNHAQAVAFAADRFGVPAVVVMPTSAPAVKVAGARRLGAEIVFEGTTSLERQARAEAIAAERGLAMIPPFDHADIIAGQGTVGVEILQDWPAAEAVLVPVGGGGLLSGVAAWVKHARPDCVVVGVEPEGANAMRRSLDAGHCVTLERIDTIADGLAPVRPAELTFAHTAALVDDVVVVTDTAIREAAARLLVDSRIVVEFSGAVAVAALLSGAWQPHGRRTAAVLSGGNLDPEQAIALLRDASA